MLKITKQIREFIKSNTQLSANARLLYLLLADRAELSSKNAEQFSDEHGIFIYFTVAEVMSVLGCSNKTALKVLDELEHNKLIIRKHTQRADKIYVLQNVGITQSRVKDLHGAECKNYTVQSVEITPNQNTNNQKKNYRIYTESSSSSSSSNKNTKCENFENDYKSSKKCKPKEKPTESVTSEEVKQQVNYSKLIDNCNLYMKISEYKQKKNV